VDNSLEGLRFLFLKAMITQVQIEGIPADDIFGLYGPWWDAYWND